AMDIGGLVEIKHPIGTPAKRVEDVVRIFRAEAAQDDPLAVRSARAFAVGQVNQVRTVGHIGPAVARLDSGGNEQPLGKYGRLVGPAFAARIFENDDLVVGLLAGLDLGINFAGRDPQPAGGV